MTTLGWFAALAAFGVVPAHNLDEVEAAWVVYTWCGLLLIFSFFVLCFSPSKNGSHRVAASGQPSRHRVAIRMYE
jgi:cell division protein FtsW (lipid II flippase)